MTRAATVLLVFSSIFALTVRADQVSLKNGDRLTGTITSSDAKTLVLKTEAAGEVTFQWSAIDAITSTQPLHVGLAGGQMVVGPVTTKDGQIAGRDANRGRREPPRRTRSSSSAPTRSKPPTTQRWNDCSTRTSATSGVGRSIPASALREAIRPPFPTLSREGPCARQIATKSLFIRPPCMEKMTRPPRGQVIAHQITGGVRGDINFSARWFAYRCDGF